VKTFAQTVTEAVADISQRGYTSPDQIAEWMRVIREAAMRSLTPPHVLEDALKSTFGRIYARMIDKGAILKYHEGIPRFAIDQLRPRLRAELDRRIMASAGLIKLNRTSAIEKTLQRFAGWATSVPPGGSDVIAKSPVKSDIRKALVSLPFEERRVAIDQGQKFAADLSHIIAMDQNAIAGIWRHHYKRYPRKPHEARDGHILLVRHSWAHAKGLVKPGPDGFTDDVERPGELVYCGCSYEWVYNLRRLPNDMLTEKGRQSLIAARAAMVAT
jgi:hypothetical protein